jgi:hypothetical protein
MFEGFSKWFYAYRNRYKVLPDDPIPVALMKLARRCLKDPWNQNSWRSTCSEARAMGPEVIPHLVDIIENDYKDYSKSDYAKWAVNALGEFGDLAVQHVPMLFRVADESVDRHDDMLGLAASEAIKRIGPGSLDFWYELVEHGTAEECGSALWYINLFAPLTPSLFEYFKNQLLHGWERNQAYIVQFLPRFPEHEIEAFDLITRVINTTQDDSTRWTSALTIAEIARKSPMVEMLWKNYKSNPDNAQYIQLFKEADQVAIGSAGRLRDWDLSPRRL